MPETKSVFCLGHISADIIINRSTLEDLRVGGCIPSQELALYPGGDVANVSFWLGKLNVATSMFGITADDHLGHFLKSGLEKANVKCFLKYSKKYPTASILIVVEKNGERSFIINGKCQDDLYWNDLPLNEIMQSDLFYTTSYTVENPPIKSTIQQLLRYIKSKNTNKPEIMFNLASYTIIERFNTRIQTEILPHIDILVGNYDEFGLLDKKTSRSNKFEIGYFLLDRYPNLKIVLITDGCNGTNYITRNEEGHKPAPNISVVDSTGAGDGFSAGFISGYISGATITESVSIGTSLGSNICQGYGARYDAFFNKK